MEFDSGYDNFAEIYNRYWAEFPLRILPILERLALKDHAPGTAILDVCCGTGQLAKALSKRGYAVAGVDASEQMLKHARLNAPDATFYCFDIRAFELPSEFAIAFSTFDSLNHLLTLADLKKVFANVYRHLSAQGAFVFDMNLESGFRSRWILPFNIWAEDTVVIAESNYDEDEKLATIKIRTFARTEADKSLWRRADVTLSQRAYEADEIVAGLAEAGFTDIEVFDARRDLDLRQVGRAFFRAHKS